MGLCGNWVWWVSGCGLFVALLVYSGLALGLVFLVVRYFVC